MHVTGNFKYDVSPTVVYRTFTDQDALSHAVPQLQELDEVEPDHYRTVVQTNFFGIKNTYQGFLTVTDREPDRAYRLLIDLQGMRTYARGNVLFRFLPLDGGRRCQVTYDADVELGGVQMLPTLARTLGEFFLRGMAEVIAERTRYPTA